MREIQLETADGLRLYGWIRQPAGRPNGVIAHVHGMGEHSRRYDHLMGCWETMDTLPPDWICAVTTMSPVGRSWRHSSSRGPPTRLGSPRRVLP